jgi:large exoprotein involved in heme utilization and adhesion
MFVGGPVQIDNGRVISPGSYVELGGVGGLGTVGLSTTGEDWQLAIADGVTRADVSIRNESDIIVKGASGSIRILAQDIDIFGSQLRIEIPSDSRLLDTQTGNLELNATSSITSDLSDLTNNLFGEGTIGSINLTAGNTISLDDTFIFSILGDTDVGKVGNVNLVTGSLFLTRGASLAVVTYGQGNAGSVNIDARNIVSFDTGSTVFNLVLSTGIGNAGGINITTGALFVRGGSGLNSSLDGQGNAGSVNINARDLVSLDGYASDGDPSSILNIVDANGIGNAGDINITTGLLFVTRGASLYSFASGIQGNAGSVNSVFLS